MNSKLSDPFTQCLNADEHLFWIGRPSKDGFLKHSRSKSNKIRVIGCLFALLCFFGVLYSSDTFIRYCCGFNFFASLVAVGCVLKPNPDDYHYAPWYALTNQQLLLATLDDGGFVIRKIKLSTISSVEVIQASRKINLDAECDTATIICRVRSRFWTDISSGNIKMKMIEQPKQIEDLIKTLVFTR